MRTPFDKDINKWEGHPPETFEFHLRLLKLECKQEGYLRCLEDMGELVKAVAEHLTELAEAWQRGALTELDGKGGTRSNRNRDVLVRLQTALAKFEESQK